MLTNSFSVLDQRFTKLVLGNIHLEKLWTGCRWAEGPAYLLRALSRLVRHPQQRMLRFDEPTVRSRYSASPATTATPYRRSRRASRFLRTPVALRHPHRTRWDPHRAR